MLLHNRKTRLEWALGEEVGRNRNIFLVGVVLYPLVTAVFSYQLSLWDQEKVRGCSEEENGKAKPENKQKRVRKKPSELSKALWLGKHGGIKYLLHIYVRIYSRISPSKDSRSRH